jgi:hypothetical protein
MESGHRDHLPGLFDGFESFMRALAEPISLVGVVLLGQGNDRENSAIHLAFRARSR